MDTEVKISKQYKDTLFKFLFGNKKHKKLALMLCNALTGNNFTDTRELKIATLENSVYITIKNDISILLCYDLYMFEQQSTLNKNMPIRLLQYLTEQYNKYLKEWSLNPLHYKQIILPVPHCYIFYNGDSSAPEREELRLSDCFNKNGNIANADLELLVHFYNINAGNNTSLKEQCRPLLEYSQITAGIKRRIAETKKFDPNFKVTNEFAGEALNAELKLLPEDSLVKEAIMAEREKVITDIFHEYSQREIEKLHEDDVKDAVAEAKAKKDAEFHAKMVQIVKDMFQDGVPFNSIVKYSHLPKQEVERIIREIKNKKE